MVISAASQALPGGEESPVAANPSRPQAGAVQAGHVQDLPLVDPAVLQDLEDQLGRADLATNFAKDYAGLWEQRVRRIAVSFANEDQAAALDAVISLKVSSTMVGARYLAGLAQTLEGAVREGDFSHGGLVLALISVHGRTTVDALQRQHLQHRP